MKPSLSVRIKDFIKFKLITCYNFFVPSFVKKHWMEEHEKKINVFYSQEGEDILLNRIFENKYDGFYVDIGAHHPTRFSNTYLFYKKGWTGINIDAMPNSMIEFNVLRPKDINIEVAISNEESVLTYYEFNEKAINTFSKTQADKIIQNNVYKLVNEHNIRTTTLENLLDKHYSINKPIDFMSIDVEGLDFMVLKSNNWSKYKPTYVLVETLSSDISSVLESDVYKFLQEKGYNFFAKTKNTCFFELKN